MARKTKNDAAKFLRKLRESKELTQGLAAEQLGVNMAQYGAWERNGRLPTDQARVEKLATILGTTEKELRAGVKNGAPRKRRARKRQAKAAKPAPSTPPTENPNTAVEPLLVQTAPAAPAVAPDDAGEPMGNVLPILRVLVARGKPVTLEDIDLLTEVQITLEKPLTSALIDALLEHQNS